MSVHSRAACVVVMGVSGVGKSTTAELIADTLGWPLAEADDFHPPANIDKMAAGLPLTDADRAPWLRAIRDWVSARSAAGVSVVVSCSALKRSYRDVLREADAQVRFVFLHAGEHMVLDRLSKRSGHFMPATLLGSQFADLEPLASDEDGVTIDPSGTPRAVAATALMRLGLSAPSDPRQSTSNGA
ncbi:MAG: AAA family ATPase [Actinophytocola sp.]|nr:AAA family ATPase [Actinophytocola sp.]